MIRIAKEAAGHGFDELQFDNVRFPERGEVPEASYSRRDTPGNRTSAITGFWQEVHRQLAPFNVCLSRGGPAAGAPACTPDDPLALPDYLSPMPGSGRGWTGAAGDKGDPAKMLRAYIPCGSAPANQTLQTAVAACRAAGASGWVLCDPDGNYDLSRGSLNALVPKDE